MASTAIPARVSAEEWQTRCDLAACYRLVDLFGWSDLINTRITARVPGRHDQFLINPYGLLFDEVTASSLVKIDVEGNKVESSESEVNSGGFAIPSTIHMARPEVACVLHTHSGAGFHPITEEVVTAAYNRPTDGRNEPAKYEWPALLRKLDRIDPSYKQ